MFSNFFFRVNKLSRGFLHGLQWQIKNKDDTSIVFDFDVCNDKYVLYPLFGLLTWSWQMFRNIFQDSA